MKLKIPANPDSPPSFKLEFSGREIKIPPNPGRLPCFELDFVNVKLKVQWITREEKDRLLPEQRDAHFDMTNGTWFIRTENGDRRGSPHRFPFGPARWELTTRILINAPDYLYPPSRTDVYAMFYRIQKTFGKPPEQRRKRSKKKPRQKPTSRKRKRQKSSFWFEVERNPDYRIRLNPARSFRIITDHKFNGIPHECLEI